MPAIWTTLGGGNAKYLIKRRDGSLPEWPSFVLGARDRAAAWTMRFYAVLSYLFFRDREYSASVWAKALEFDRYRLHLGDGDPPARKYRDEDFETVNAIHGEPSFLSLLAEIADHKPVIRMSGVIIITLSDPQGDTPKLKITGNDPYITLRSLVRAVRHIEGNPSALRFLHHISPGIEVVPQGVKV